MLKEQVGNVALYRQDSNPESQPDKNNIKGINKDTDKDKEAQRMMEIVRHCKSADFKSEIIAGKSWNVMYQLAETRGNVIEWMEIPRQAKVLELAAGCGTVTSVLLEKGAEVTCQEADLSYCRINAERHRQSEALTIYASSFADCESELADDFDVAVVIGSEEFIEQPERTLRMLRRHLKPDGMLALAVENKFGLKYWAGNKEPHTHKYFAGLEQAGIRLYSRNGLKKLLLDAGFSWQEFYYPYPDYRFAQDIYSDRHLPHKGDLNYNIANYEDDRIIVFDEQKVFDSIIEENQFPFFANSFLCLAGAETRGGMGQNIVYTRYAADRSREYAVRTDITDANVCKRPLYPEGSAHVAHIAEAYERLCEQYADTDLKFNRCRLNGQMHAEFELIRAQALQTQAEQSVASGQTETVFAILQRMMQYIRSSKKQAPFTKTQAFTQVFGDISGLDVLQGAACSEVSDIDLVLPNIFVDADGKWHVIDYEWTFFFPVPQNFIIYRTLFFLNHENPGHEQLTMDRLLAAADISQEEAAVYAQMEAGFQQFVTGGQAPYREAVNIFGRTYMDIAQLKEAFDNVARQNEALKSKGLWKIAKTIRNKLR